MRRAYQREGRASAEASGGRGWHVGVTERRSVLLGQSEGGEKIAGEEVIR